MGDEEGHGFLNTQGGWYVEGMRVWRATGHTEMPEVGHQRGRCTGGLGGHSAHVPAGTAAGQPSALAPTVPGTRCTSGLRQQGATDLSGVLTVSSLFPMGSLGTLGPAH